MQCSQDKWVPDNTAWHILSLRLEKWPPIWRVAANILNKQLWTADKGRYCSLGLADFEKLLTVKMYHITKYNRVLQTWIDNTVTGSG